MTLSFPWPTKERKALVGVNEAITYGATASFSTADIDANTTAVQAAIDALPASGGKVHVPAGVWYNWHTIFASLPDYTEVEDDSGYDPKAGAGVQQSYKRILRKTNATTGTTNGNTHWLTADYHPAYVTQTLASPGDGGARGSLVQWIGDTTTPSKYGAQWNMDYTDASNPIIGISGYDNTASPPVATRVFDVRHPADANNSGAFGNGIPTTGYTFEFFMAGLSTIGTYLTKNLVGGFTLPSSSTGIIELLWKAGSTVRHRMQVSTTYVRNVYTLQKQESYSGGYIYTDTTKATYGALRKIVNLPDNSSTITITDLDGAIFNNSLFTATRTKTLPAATVGRHFRFEVTAAQAIQIDPSGSEAFLGEAAGKYKSSSTVGSVLEIWCASAGVWSFIEHGTWATEA